MSTRRPVRRQVQRLCRKLNLRHGALVLLSGAVVFTVQWAMADETHFTKRPYVGVGVGVSSLDPEAQCPCVTVGDGTDTAFMLTGGYDLSRHFTIDAYYNDAGAAGIDFLGDRVGELDYQTAGISGIGYLFNSQGAEGLDRREGLGLFLRLGAGIMQNDSSLDFDRDHTAHVMAGIGAEYGWQNGLAVRAELNSYDTDAQTLSVSLLKRFGTVPQRTVATAVPAVIVPEPEAPKPVVTVVENTRVNFAFAADDLSVSAVQALVELAAQLKQNTSVSLAIEGHADNIDTQAFNQALSERRAEAVKAWLISNGIDAGRLSTQGFGEDRPIASNATPEGRAQNRRVDIRVR